MSAKLPDGEPAPSDGSLPTSARAQLRCGHAREEGVQGEEQSQPADHFGVYVHVPYCATRCGYCDFNTYTLSELAVGEHATHTTPAGTATDIDSYLSAVLAEIELASRVLATKPGPERPRIDTVFFGGGTPTLLPTAHLATILRRLDSVFGLALGAEVSTEANPESVDSNSLAALVDAGFTRISLGMQSAVPHVLATLDRRHTPGLAVAAAAQARQAGFAHVNVDLIYGAPTETDTDWLESLNAAVSAKPDHISAYALTVEPGTRLARQVRSGELAAPDDDALADRYLLTEQILGEAGMGWYEISNWARTSDDRCRHNQLYWRGGNWWGFGPGAHSHVGGVRWWNVKHPAAYTARLAAGSSPAHSREVLSSRQRRDEDLMLRLRLVEGYPLHQLEPAGQDGARRAVDDGLLRPDAHAAGRACLTLRGRLIADTVLAQLSP